MFFTKQDRENITDPKRTELYFDDRGLNDKAVAMLVKEIKQCRKEVTLLSLQHNNITSRGAFLLAGLESLQALILSYNNVSDLGCVTLLKTEHLQTLALDHNALTAGIVDKISSLRRRQKLELNISGNNLDETTVAEIQQKTLPRP